MTCDCRYYNYVDGELRCVACGAASPKTGTSVKAAAAVEDKAVRAVENKGAKKNPRKK